MNDLSFCENLKRARQRIGLTQQQIADSLGITKSTYCGYETGKRQPDIAKLRRLSLLLCISVDEMLGLVGSEPECVVSKTEYEQIKLFRALDAYGQRNIRAMLVEETNRVRAQMRDTLISTAQNGPMPLRIALKPAGAEQGAYLGPDGFRLALIRRETLPQGASFGVPIHGTSLEPLYHDRDILIFSDAKPKPGDVGIFLKDMHGTVRLMGYGELLSINPVYLPQPLDDTIIPCGTVIGVISQSDLL